MIVEFITQYAYSIDRVNIVSSNVGDTADLSYKLAMNLINKGVCKPYDFNPVAEAKVITPEIKEDKPKRKRRSKKKAE